MLIYYNTKSVKVKRKINFFEKVLIFGKVKVKIIGNKCKNCAFCEKDEK